MSTNTRTTRSDPTLKDSMEQLLSDQALTDAELRELGQLQADVLNDEIPSKGDAGRHRLSPARIGPWLVACGVLICGLLLYGGLQPGWMPVPDKPLQIAREAASNHINLKPLDTETSSYGELQGFFDRLDFSPVRSGRALELLSLPNETLLGGRYCSLKGVTALQLRFGHGEKAVGTLYQVGYDPALFGDVPDAEAGELPLIKTTQGLKVSLWTEKGLLMVLVEPFQ